MKNEDWTNKQKNTLVLQCMSMLAFGSITGSLLLGYVMDKRGSVACVYVVLITTIIVQTSHVIFNEIHTWNFFGYFITFGSGFYDAVIINLINNMLGFEFESKMIPFAAQKFV